VNKATETVTGVPREELIGSDFSDYFTDPEKARVGYERVFKEGAVHDYPLEVLHRDGHLTPVLYNASLYRDAQGNDAGVFAAARDVTELKRAETMLRDMQRRESLGVLTAGIAHDYNNLLGVMMGNISFAQTQMPTGHPAVKTMEKALAAMDRAAGLTQQMLAYSGKGRYQVRTIDLAALIREHASLYTVSVPKNVKLVTHLSSSPVYIKGDLGQIEQILMNLIINGGEAIGSEQGVVAVTVAEESMKTDTVVKYSLLAAAPLSPGRYAYLEVRDTGSGMSPETAAKMFDPFFTTKFTGRGLGLSAVLGIIQGHKGGLLVDSKEGEGTTFRLILPSAPPPASTTTQEG
jgi:PAS domain S-box-containing protein